MSGKDGSQTSPLHTEDAKGIICTSELVQFIFFDDENM